MTVIRGDFLVHNNIKPKTADMDIVSLNDDSMLPMHLIRKKGASRISTGKIIMFTFMLILITTASFLNKYLHSNNCES